MAAGYCAGIVVTPPEDFGARILRMPRVLLPLPGGKDFLVADVGQWDNSGGKVFRLTAERGQPAILTPVLTDLYMPHGIMRGPDDKIYVNESGRIFRFDPGAADPQATMETVIAGLPDTRIHFSLHPLSSFMFDANKDLLVAVGAPTDQCTKDDMPDGTDFCAQSEGPEKAALVRRYAYQGGGKYTPDFTVMAQGLRNSVAMVRHRSGTLLQAENGMDFAPADSPFEELNVLHQGAHYGWPYCYEMGSTAPVWAQAHVMDCNGPAHTKPVRLLPPHSAPLSMLYYDGKMFPKLRGKLLISLHGYRPAGARIAGLLLTRKPLHYRAGPTLLAVVAAFGAMMIVFGLSRSLPLSLAALAVSGFVDMISMNIRSTAALLVTPPELQGRVGAVEWVFISASNELGAFESGAVARLIGTVPAVVAGGAVMIGAAASWGRLFPSLARMGRLDELRPEPT